MNENIKIKTFKEVDLNDEFFSSLKADYPGFEQWFNSHPERKAYVLYDNDSQIKGFLHLKEEEQVVDDVRPQLYANKILKVATFKVEAHGTKMGEQFIKIIMDNAIEEKVEVCYVTIFPKHEKLIELVKSFGFEEYGEKGDISNPEKVYVKKMGKITGDIYKDYPNINVKTSRKYLLGIHPRYHSVMFPHSILKTESKSIITDVSHTNSIRKIYVCSMVGIENLKQGDVLVLYRTAEYGKSAEYSSVVTSVCVVEEVKMQGEFASFDEFYKYASQYSVFDRADLYKWYRRGGCKTIKMTYNAAMKKRVIRHDLIKKIGMNRESYWGFMPISNEQFNQIMEQSEVNSNIFV